MFRKSHSLRVANVILECIKARLTEDQAWKFKLEPYLNGREVGWALVSIYTFPNSKKVVWAESRKSDNIVIYRGNTLTFSMQGNTPDEETYREKTFLGEGKYIEAVDLILDWLEIKPE